MTICKTFKRLPEKGQSYKKAELLANMGPGDQMSANFFDPGRAILYSFYKEDNDTCENVVEKGRFRYRRLDGVIMEVEHWELGKVRHIFFERSGQPKGKYEYLGETLDEEEVTLAGHTWKQYTLR
jgi:hypothetical protein